MDKRGKRQASSLLGGMGFYISLLVCVIAAGVVGYFALLNDGEGTEPLNSEPMDVTVDAVTGGETTPVGDNSGGDVQLVLSEEPVVTQPVTAPVQQEEVTEPEDEAVETVGEETLTVPAMGDEEIADEPESEPEVQTAPVSAKIVSPLAGETVAVFSVDQLMYDHTLGDWRTHDGIDIRAEAGTDVVATAAGTVIAVGEDGRLGVTVQIEHSGGYVTTYASLHPEILVEEGQTVAAGEIIGTVGNTSLTEAGLGAHLHFSVTRNGEMIDPEVYLPAEE